MIFTGFDALKDFDVQLGSNSDDFDKGRLQYIEYEDGSFDYLDFGTRWSQEANFSISAIPKEDYANLVAYLLESEGSEILVTDSSDVFNKGALLETDRPVYLSKVTPKGEVSFSTVGFYEVDISLVIPEIDTVKRDFLVEIDLNAWSVDVVYPDIPTLDANVGPTGETAHTLDPRKLWVSNGATWDEQFPLKPYEVTYYVTELSDIVSVPREAESAFTTIDGTYYLYTSGVWVVTPYPDLSPFKPVVNNDPSIGLLNGVLYWSAFSDGNYNSKDYLSGFIAKKGITFPLKSAPLSKGFGVEILDGFKVKINNAEQFQLENVEFNFFGSICTLMVYLDGNIVTERVGQNKTNSFNPAFFELDVEPFLWLDQNKKVPSETFADNGNNGTDPTPILFGEWLYTQLVPSSKTLDFVQSGTGTTFPIIYDTSFSAFDAEMTINIARPNDTFTLPSISPDRAEWFIISPTGDILTPVSQVLDPTIENFAPHGSIQVVFETEVDLTDSIRAGQNVQILQNNITFVVDESTTVNPDTGTLYIYDSGEDTYKEIPAGLFVPNNDGGLDLVINPEFVTVKDDNTIEIRRYVGNGFINPSNLWQTIQTGTDDLGGVVYRIGNDDRKYLNLEYQTPEELNYSVLKYRGTVGGEGANLQRVEIINGGSDPTDGTLREKCFINTTEHPLSPFFSTQTQIRESIAAYTQIQANFAPPENWFSGALTRTRTINNLLIGFQDPTSSALRALPDSPQTGIGSRAPLGGILAYQISDETKNSLRGAETVSPLVNFSFLAYQTNAINPAPNGTLLQGFYGSVRVEVWLRHRSDSGLDRLSVSKNFVSVDEGSTAEIELAIKNVGVTGVQSLLAKTGSGDTETRRKAHVFCNMPESLGGDDLFYTGDEDLQTPWFWVFTNTDNGVTEFKQGDVLTNISNGDKQLIVLDDSFRINYQDNVSPFGSTAIKMRVTGTGINPALPEDVRTGDNLRLGGVSSTDIVGCFTMGYPDFYWAGKDLFKFDDAVVKDLFASDSYLFPDYERVEFAFFPYRSSVGTLGTARTSILLGLGPTNILSTSQYSDSFGNFPITPLDRDVSGQRTYYNNLKNELYFDLSAEVDLSQDYYITAEGREDPTTGDLVNNPREIAETLVKQVQPNFNITPHNSYFDREAWKARNSVRKQTTVKEILNNFCRHTMSVLTYDDTQSNTLIAKSAFLGDLQQTETNASFNAANISKKSAKKVKFRDIKDINSDFTFKYHLNQGSDKLDRELRIRLSTNGSSLLVSGLESLTGDPQVLQELKADLADSLDALLLEEFQTSKTYYNTGVENSFVDDYEWFYDTPQNSGDTFGIQAMVALSKKWSRFRLFNAWEISFITNMDYVLYKPEVNNSDNRLRLADYIDFQLAAITGTFNLVGLISKIKPDYYNGKVEISLFAQVDPFIYTTYYDKIWNGGLTGSPDYDTQNFRLSPLFKYPFKDPNQDFTFPDGGDVSDPSFDLNDHQFTDNSFADPEDPFEPLP